MSIVNTTECIICYNEYDTETRKPCIGTCGHSICENCKHQMVSAKCPQCNREEAFSLTTINYQVLELIKHLKSLQAGEQTKIFKASDESKNLEEGVCSECTLASRKLRICVTCALQDGILTQDKGSKELSLNTEHCSVDTAIANAKAMAICGDCALDGEHHEGHKTIHLATLKNNLDTVLQDTVRQKLTQMEDASKGMCKKLQGHFEEAIKALTKHFELYAKLPNHQEKRVHFNNVEAYVEQMNNTITMVEDSCNRLDRLTEEFIVETEKVATTKKAASKAATMFASLDPVLVADRKQSAKEPLLIGLFNPKTKIWTPVGRMPNPKSNYAVACNKSQIFIVGGMNNGAWLNTLEMYDRDKNLRREVLLQCSKMKQGRTRTSAGFHNSKLYVIGGYDGAYMSSVEFYDPEHGDWKTGPALQRPRADSSIVSCNGELFVLGGFNGKEYEEKIEKLNETAGSTPKFEIVGDMQGSRAGFGACSFKGRIYIAGGWSSSNNTLKSVRSYDPITKTWRDEPSLNRDRKYFTLHATNEAIYAIRGCADSWSLINEVERLNTSEGSWETISCATQTVGQQPQQQPVHPPGSPIGPHTSA